VRRAATATIAATAILGVSVAVAAVPKGTYRGKTSDGGVVKLTVSKQKLIKVTRKSLRFTCTDGDVFKSRSDTAAAEDEVDVSSKRFEIEETTEGDGVHWVMTGRFSVKKRKVKGTYSETRTFNEQNQLDDDGTITCKTRDLTYSAALPRKR
jgi:hypothetical protein